MAEDTPLMRQIRALSSDQRKPLLETFRQAALAHAAGSWSDGTIDREIIALSRDGEDSAAVKTLIAIREARYAARLGLSMGVAGRPSAAERGPASHKEADGTGGKPAGDLRPPSEPVAPVERPMDVAAEATPEGWRVCLTLRGRRYLGVETYATEARANWAVMDAVHGEQPLPTVMEAHRDG